MQKKVKQIFGKHSFSLFLSSAIVFLMSQSAIAMDLSPEQIMSNFFTAINKEDYTSIQKQLDDPVQASRPTQLTVNVALDHAFNCHKYGIAMFLLCRPKGSLKPEQNHINFLFAEVVRQNKDKILTIFLGIPKGFGIDQKGMNLAFSQAAVRKDYEAMKALLDLPDHNLKPDQDGANDALMEAAELVSRDSTFRKVIEFLLNLDEKYRPNQDGIDKSFTVSAIRYHDDQLVKDLIDHPNQDLRPSQETINIVCSVTEKYVIRSIWVILEPRIKGKKYIISGEEYAMKIYLDSHPKEFENFRNKKQMLESGGKSWSDF